MELRKTEHIQIENRVADGLRVAPDSTYLAPHLPHLPNYPNCTDCQPATTIPLNRAVPVPVSLSIIVPCFNEEETVPIFYEETLKHTVSIDNVEFIFIDDCSTDGTLSILQELSKTDERVHYISFSRNFGKEAAILAGLKKAKGEHVVTMDADLQDPPSLLPQMFTTVASGEFDCVGTCRTTRKHEPPIRSFLAKQFYRVMEKITDIKIVDGARDFRLMNRQYVDAVLSLPERNRFSKGIFPWVGFRNKLLAYENIPRVAGETKWSFWKLFLYALDGIVAFSTKPLALGSVCAVIMFILAFLGMGAVIAYKIIWDQSIPGWASLSCIILFCSGVQLLCTGIIGQYLAKIYTEIKNRPQYIIREEK